MDYTCHTYCHFGIELGPHEIQYQPLLIEVAFMKEKNTDIL